MAKKFKVMASNAKEPDGKCIPKSMRKSVESACGKKKAVKASNFLDALNTADVKYNADFKAGPYACAEVDGKGYMYCNFKMYDRSLGVKCTNVYDLYSDALENAEQWNKEWKDETADRIWELQHGVESACGKKSVKSSKSVKKFGIKAAIAGDLTNKDKRSIKTLIDKFFTNDGKSYKSGDWRIGAGGYDLVAELYEQDIPVCGINIGTFGFLADIKGGKLLPLSTLCVVVVALLNTVLLGRETYILNMCLYYVAITSVIAYYNLTFLRLAARTKRPAVWAVMGRVLDSAAVILGMTLKFSALSQVAVLIIDIIALVVVIVMMALTGAFDLSKPEAVEEAPVPETIQEPELPPDPFPVIQDSYRITPSEMKVLRELVTTDDKQDVIALRLNISVSTLRHHVTSIYKKTGVQTRSALCKLVINN